MTALTLATCFLVILATCPGQTACFTLENLDPSGCGEGGCGTGGCGEHGCCPNSTAPAHGPRAEGCCLLDQAGCCPDFLRPGDL